MDIRKSTQATAKKAGIKIKKPISKYAAERSKRRKQKYIFTIVFALVSVVLFVMLMRSNLFEIRNVSVSGVNPTSSKQIIESTETFLQSSRLLFLPHRNIFMLPVSQLETHLYKTNSNIETFEIKRNGLHSLSITAKNRTPAFLFGTEDLVLYIDKTGFVYEDQFLQSPQQIGHLATTTLNLQETSQSYSGTTTQSLPIDLPSMIGKQIETSYFNNLIFLAREIQKKNIDVRGVTLRPYGDADIRVGNLGGGIRINLYDNPERVLSTFSAARKVEPLRSQMINNQNSLLYIDLRFGNKVFYKFQ